MSFCIVYDISVSLHVQFIVSRRIKLRSRNICFIYLLRWKCHLRPRVKTTTYGKNYFKYTTAVLWNDLPDEFRRIANFNQFKNILLSWNGNKCKCNACKTF